MRERIGVAATGRAFNSLAAIEASLDGRTNPMVNSGAIATTSLVPGANTEEKWQFIQSGLSRFAGRELSMNEEVLNSALQTNHRNRSIARLLHSLNAIFSDPDEAVELYTRQCSLNVSVRDLAVMGATLADGGVHPITKERVVSPATCHDALAVTATAGLYESSGDWLYEIGLPGKSGLGTFAPPLDAAGNGIKGQRVAKFLSQNLGMDRFVSMPVAKQFQIPALVYSLQAIPALVYSLQAIPAKLF